MKKNKAILFLTLITVNLLAAQIFNIKINFQLILITNIFLFSLSFLTHVIQVKILKYKKPTTSHFLTINFIRILLCVIFLLSNKNLTNIYIYNFFIIYFIYLFSDMFFKHRNANKINI